MLSSSLCKYKGEQDRIVIEAMFDQCSAENVQTLISRT